MNKKKISRIIAGALAANVALSTLSDAKTVSALELSNVSTDDSNDLDNSNDSTSAESAAEATGNDVTSEQMKKDFESMVSEVENDSISLYSDESVDSINFSDLSHNTSLSEMDWKTVHKNSSNSGKNIQLLVDGTVTTLTNGIGVDSNAKVVYDISSYSNTYGKLVGYIGVDNRQSGKGDGVEFSIDVSNDGINWTRARYIGVKTASQESYKLSMNVSNVKYVRFNALAGPRGNKSYDHAVFGDLKLVDSNYEFETINENSVSFSFSGNNAKTLFVDSIKDDSVIQYSLDGGSKWITPSNFDKDEFGHKLIHFSEEELNSINADNDIKVKVGYYEYVVDIKSATAPSSSTVYANDLEDRLIGSIDNLEYRVNGGEWQDYNSNIKFTGLQSVEVRYKAKGNTLPSPSYIYTFTESLDTPQRTYVPLSEVALYKFCSEQNNGYSYAKNLIDGNKNTLWHNNWNGESNLYYSVKFTDVKSISSIEYLPVDGENGRLRSGEILVSMDGETWDSVATFKDLANNAVLKTINISNPMPARYLKIRATQTWGRTQNVFFSGKMLNFYQDTTKSNQTDPYIRYSTLEKTNNYVLATLILPDGYTATEKTYKFTSNGYHDFEYEDTEGNVKTVRATVENIVRDENAGSIYLSDLDYEMSKSTLGWNGVKNDLDPNGGSISLLVNGLDTTFKKGVGAHAPSEVVYDVEAFVSKYPNFSVYLGVDSDRKSNGSVSFTILASKDGQDWDTLSTTETLSGDSPAIYVNVDLSDYVYLKLKADALGNSANDYSVYADARLVPAGYDIGSEVYTGFKSLAEYDAEISSRSVQDNFNNHKRQILEREFVNRIGYGNILSASRDVDGVYGALEWIQTDDNALNLFIESGDLFSGTGYNALVSLGKLYKEFKNDVSNPIYKKMLIATAVAYSKDLIPFQNNYGGNYVGANPVESYRNFKKLYDSGKFVRKSEFESYNMELVRAVVDSRINYDEILWLRDYIDTKYPDTSNWRRYNGYGFAAYVNTGYNKPEFYSEANKQKWDEKYGFLKYNISYGNTSLYRIWMVMEAGAICWGLSGLGMNLNEVQGIPAIGTFQPGHEAYLLYSVKNGKGIWSISDDAEGWGKSFTRWGNSTKIEHRMLLSWGQKEYNQMNSWKSANTSYMLLAQDALNDYDNYLNSMYYNLMAKSYDSGSKEREEALNESLKCYDKNLDSIYDLYKEKSSDPSMTDETWFKFAEMIAEKYTYFPAPMYDLLNLIKSKITDESIKISIEVLQNETLKKASNATSAQSLQDAACRQVANQLLNNVNTDLATFSFSGENANKIVINERYSNSTIQVRVSLDGGNTWEKFENDEKFTTQHVIQLTDEQIKKINSTDDILVGLMGVAQNFTIDIKDGLKITTSLLYKNDLENKLFGDTSSLEYSEDEINWYDYTNETRFPSDSDRKVYFRYKARGVYLQGPSSFYTFTADSNNPKRKYITIDHLSVKEYSSSVSSNEKGDNIISGSGNNGWHSSANDSKKFITVELDSVRYISALDYYSDYNSGKIESADIYTSLDGKTWTKSASVSGWKNNASVKAVEFESPAVAKYVKIVATNTHLGNSYITAKMINFYEDTTQTYNPEKDVKIEYSITEPTTSNVKATLVLPEGCEVVGESEHEFIANGSFVFNYKDANGELRSITAVVDNIERELPSMTYSFDKKGPTNQNVTLTIDSFSNDTVKLVGVDESPSFNEKGEYVPKEENNKVDSEVVTQEESNNLPYTYVFKDNSKVVFILEDGYGVRNYIPVTVDWIDRKAPEVSVKYDIQEPTYDRVTATLVGVKEGEKVTSNGGTTHVFDKNGKFEFVVEDEAGNVAKVIAEVNWIRENSSDKDENLDDGFLIPDEDNSNTGGDNSNTDEDNSNTGGSTGDSNTDEDNSNTGGSTEGGSDSDNSNTGGSNEDGSGSDSSNESNDSTSEKDPNIDEDFTVVDSRDLEVQFDYTTITNKDVTATLVGLLPGDEVISDGGKTHKFTTNGKFTFKVKDVNGNIFDKVVEVNWIDKDAPTAVVVFDYSKASEGKVIAKLVDMSEEDVTLLNDGLEYHEFTSNGSHTFEFVDKAGNKGSVVAHTDWFDFKDLEYVVQYENVIEEDEGSQGDSEIDYVIATLSLDTDKIEILNNEGSNKVKFVKNGEFRFRARMIDSDYEFEILVKVDCLSETASEDESPIEVPSDSENGSDSNGGSQGGSEENKPPVDNENGDSDTEVKPPVDGDSSGNGSEDGNDSTQPPVDSDGSQDGSDSSDDNTEVKPPVDGDSNGSDSDKDESTQPPVDGDNSNNGSNGDGSNEDNSDESDGEIEDGTVDDSDKDDSVDDSVGGSEGSDSDKDDSVDDSVGGSEGSDSEDDSNDDVDNPSDSEDEIEDSGDSDKDEITPPVDDSIEDDSDKDEITPPVDDSIEDDSDKNDSIEDDSDKNDSIEDDSDKNDSIEDDSDKDDTTVDSGDSDKEETTPSVDDSIEDDSDKDDLLPPVDQPVDQPITPPVTTPIIPPVKPDNSNSGNGGNNNGDSGNGSSGVGSGSGSGGSGSDGNGDDSVKDSNTSSKPNVNKPTIPSILPSVGNSIVGSVNNLVSQNRPNNNEESSMDSYINSFNNFLNSSNKKDDIVNDSVVDNKDELLNNSNSVSDSTNGSVSDSTNGSVNGSTNDSINDSIDDSTNESNPIVPVAIATGGGLSLLAIFAWFRKIFMK